MAVYGKEPEDDKGKFHVEDFCFQLLPEQPPLPPLAEDRFVYNCYVDLPCQLTIFFITSQSDKRIEVSKKKRFLGASISHWLTV